MGIKRAQRENLHIGIVVSACSCELGEAEIPQPDVAPRVKEQVVGVQIPVNDALQSQMAVFRQVLVGNQLCIR